MTETPLVLARKAAEVLHEQGIENALLEAEMLLAAVLGIKRLDLYLQFERPLTTEELEAYRTSIRRRRRGEPVQYIAGETHFRELVLRVDRRALIPRPETEVLVGEVLRWAWARVGVQPPRSGRGRPAPEAVPEQEEVRELTALDIGTGSGAIALSLAYEGPFHTVVATDISAEAIELATENATRLGLGERLSFRLGESWEPIDQAERFDLIVSNPPYIGTEEADSLPPEVRDWEPATALFGGPGGFDAIDAIVAGAAEHLTDGGLLALEIGSTQGAEVARRIDQTGQFDAARVVRDLTDRERIVVATRRGLV